eukprot:9488994-Pyramimonas_sp.AAC.1
MVVLGHWVKAELRKHLEGVPFLLRDSDRLLRQITNVIVGSPSIILNLDVTDFSWRATLGFWPTARPRLFQTH